MSQEKIHSNTRLFLMLISFSIIFFTLIGEEEKQFTAVIEYFIVDRSLICSLPLKHHSSKVKITSLISKSLLPLDRYRHICLTQYSAPRSFSSERVNMSFSFVLIVCILFLSFCQCNRRRRRRKKKESKCSLLLLPPHHCHRLLLDDSFLFFAFSFSLSCSVVSC